MKVVGVIYAAGVAAAILVPAELLTATSHRYIIILVAFILAIAGGLIYARILGCRNRRGSEPHQPGSK